MTLNEYQCAAMRTSVENISPDDHLLNGMLGLSGESGEACDLVKKAFFQGHDLDTRHLAMELGDVMWYVAEAATAIGKTLDEIAAMNITKLKARYPEKFDPEKSVNRKDGDV